MFCGLSPSSISALKYFTKRLWRELQDRELGAAAASQWDRNLKVYLKQLEALRERLSPDVFEFFKGVDVHDGALQHFKMVEPDEERPVGGEVDEWSPPNHPVAAELAVFESDGVTLWTLSYLRVRRSVVDFPTEDPLFYSLGEGFGDLGYHELTDVGSGFLRHELLFASGAVILVEFKDIHAVRAAGS